MPTAAPRFATRTAASKSSSTATILTVVGALAALGASLGIFGANVEGALIAATSSGVVVVGLLANAFHTGRIEPSALQMGVLAFVGQAALLALDFGLVANATASHIVAITGFVTAAAVQIANALLSRQVL